jgi:hypothetical protein
MAKKKTTATTTKNENAAVVCAKPTRLDDFKELFGEQPNGCDANKVTHCKESPRIVKLCQAAMECQTAELYEYLAAWDKSALERTPHMIQQLLARSGRWEAAWSLARLHVDQVMKRELQTGQRDTNKGHPLCNVALVGHALGCRALVQHYGQLSSAGDIYRNAGSGTVAHGLAPVLMEPFESRMRHEKWRDDVASELGTVTGTPPLFLEAYLAARWFRGKHRDSIIGLAPMTPGKPASFVEVLLDEALNGSSNDDTTKQGTLFEAAAGLLLSATPGFTVYSCRWNKDEQIDLVVRYEADGIAPPCLPMGYGLVECKAEVGAVGSSTLRDFGAKCQFHRVQFGILVARAGITGARKVFQNPTAAELVRRRFLSDGLTVLVLDLEDLCGGQDRELRGLHDALFDDYQGLVFGRIVGEE